GDVLQITPASTNPNFTERGLWNTFRVCGRDDQQGAVAGAYLARQFGGKDIAILHDKSTYGKGLADQTKKALNEAGVKEKLYEAYTQGERDFNALVSRLKAAAIDVVYVGGYHTEAGLILRQMRDQGLPAQMMSGDAIPNNEFWSITGPAGEGMLFTFVPHPRKKPTAAAVVKRFREHRSGGIHALRVCGAPDMEPRGGQGRRGQGQQGCRHPEDRHHTVLGPISYTPKGDVTKIEFVVYRWNKDGTYSEL